ncbi:RNA polymerase sigma-70 factor, ECF subfamily [Draconibacterium orientale]|uniref:RNA polymerase sigma-70 factor, ECF subfamily n=1 Tax=Draconibacterium orientale TaxID=1168034 RepID=X5DYY8_9BACT|nr:RNA polymerase sigma-70 factor [Draconibacterium orientale]AHW59521.1 RNA polymerase subunit sigma-24 [Draconibacterium orientale]SES90667.1 RNA polymerase sigma-70 factor, ECF subfamily [Draconibacterium orientale]
MNSFEENNLFINIQQGDEKAFEKLFKLYYGYLCNFATKIIADDVAAEEIVQEFFVKFWERRADLSVESSLKNYLFRSVKNLCLNYIKHNNIKLQHAQKVIAESETSNFNNDYIEVDLAADIAKSIEELPKKRREIFRLSREEGLKYREIAEKLNISIKTVEAQMSLAIKSLRDKLKKYNTFIFYFFVSRAKKA